MNKAILFGNVGQDPTIRTTPGGKKVASFSLATSKRSKDREGNSITQATWHNIVAWEKLAELCEKYIKKGSSLIIEGEIIYRKYDDKDGIERNITDIVAHELHFAGAKKSESKPENTGSHSDISELPGTNIEDDLPF